MGGFGSGNWHRQFRDRVEEREFIDVRLLRRRGYIKSGCDCYWPIEQLFAFDPNFPISLFIRPLEIVWTECNYGGERPWLVCPILDCRKRSAILYSHHDGVACRACAQLSYQSQHENAAIRAIKKSRKLRFKLGMQLNLFGPIPDKPPRMHERTYMKLLTRLEQVDTVARMKLDAHRQPWRDKITKGLGGSI